MAAAWTSRQAVKLRHVTSRCQAASCDVKVSGCVISRQGVRLRHVTSRYQTASCDVKVSGCVMWRPVTEIWTSRCLVQVMLQQLDVKSLQRVTPPVTRSGCYHATKRDVTHGYRNLRHFEHITCHITSSISVDMMTDNNEKKMFRKWYLVVRRSNHELLAGIHLRCK